VSTQHLDHVGSSAARRAAVAVGVYAESLLGLLHGRRTVQDADRVGVRLGLGGVAATILVVLALRPVVALVTGALVALVLGLFLLGLLVLALVLGLFLLGLLVLGLAFGLGLLVDVGLGLRLFVALVFGRLLSLGLVVVLVFLEVLVLLEFVVFGLGVVLHQPGVREPVA